MVQNIEEQKLSWFDRLLSIHGKTFMVLSKASLSLKLHGLHQEICGKTFERAIMKFANVLSLACFVLIHSNINNVQLI